MHVLVAPGRLDPPAPAPTGRVGAPDGPGPLTTGLGAPEAARAVAAGWADARPQDALDLLALSDGGPGLLDVLQAARGGELVAVTAPDAHGRPVPAAVLVVAEGSGVRTAYLDATVVLGAADPQARPAEVTSTAGVGVLVDAALSTGAQRVVVGLGQRHPVAHDAGLGVLHALGAVGPGGDLGLAGARGWQAEQVAGLVGARERLHTVDLVVLRSHDLPLLGVGGASAALAAAGRTDAEHAQRLERATGDLVHLLDAAGGADGGRRDLLGTPGGALGHALGGRGSGRPALAPGSGAGGGAAYALGLLGARSVDGATWVADAVGLADRVAEADLVVTGVGVLDGTGLAEGVVAAVSAAALPLAVPVVALAPWVRTGRRDWGAAGVAGAYEVVERPDQEAGWLADPAAALRARVPRVARTWSR